MRVAHEADVAVFRERVASLESQNASLESERARLQRVLAETAAMAESHGNAAQEAKDMHSKTQAAAALVEQEAMRLERETADAMEKLQRQHAEAVADHGTVKSEMAVEHAESLGALKVEHAVSMTTVQSQHDETVRALRASHMDELKRVHAAHEEKLAVQQQAHENATAALTNVVRDHDTALVALQAEHKRLLNEQRSLEAQLAEARTENEEIVSRHLGSPARLVPGSVGASPASRYSKAAAPLLQGQGTMPKQLAAVAPARHFSVDSEAIASPSAAGGTAAAAGLSAGALQQWHEAQQRELARLFDESQAMQQ
eukprot:COSAG06_NODE_17062_length_963_cov_1.775463_1_plen_313_part_01